MHRLLPAVAALAVSAASASAQAVTVHLAEWKLTLSRDTVAAGPVTFRVTNDGTMTHGFFVRGPGVAKGARDLNKDESATLTVTLKPGTYELYCPLADGTHRTAGMSKQIVVVAASGSASARKPGA